MSLKIGADDVVSDSKVLSNIASLDATTTATISAVVAQGATFAVELLHTLDNPNSYASTTYQDKFGTQVAISGKRAIVGAPLEDSASGERVGVAYIYDVVTGNLLHTLTNPSTTTPAGDDFGRFADIDGNFAIIGATTSDVGGTASGRAYIYNVTTGALVHTLTNPNAYGTTATDEFGWQARIKGNYACASGYREDSALGEAVGVVYVFSVASGALLRTISNPSPSAQDQFGKQLDMDGEFLIVGAPGLGSTGKEIHVFNVTTGTLVRSWSGDDYMGYTVAISGNYAIYGNPIFSGGEGIVKVYNIATGALLRTLSNPNPYSTTTNDFFGGDLAAYGDYLLVGSDEGDAGGTGSGKAYLYALSTGTLIHTFDNPNAYNTSAGDSFARSGSYENAVGIDGIFAIFGAYEEDDAVGDRQGKAYIYSLSDLDKHITHEQLRQLL